MVRPEAATFLRAGRHPGRAPFPGPTPPARGLAVHPGSGPTARRCRAGRRLGPEPRGVRPFSLAPVTDDSDSAA